MAPIEGIFSEKAPKPLPQFSQAVKYNGMVYCSGNIGLDPVSWKVVDGTVKDRTRQALTNISAILEQAGSSLRNVVKMNIFLTNMDNFAAMNEGYDEFFTWDPKPINESKTPPEAPSPNRKPPVPSSHINPPASTRPPPLNLPTRAPNTTLFSHLFATGKAYLTFYKTGLRAILTNHRLRSSPDAPPPNTRASILLHLRSAHDVRRLPIFGLLLLVCGEFTPFVVLAVPSIVPYTCRIPRQVEKLLTKAEDRRARARDEFRWKTSAGEAVAAVGLSGTEAAGYLARVLGVVSPFWDRLGITLPAGIVGGRVKKRLAFLREDDRLLVEAGGAASLEPEEAKLACADRGISVLGLKNDQQAVALLEWWLMLVGYPEMSVEEREARMARLLLTDTKEWPNPI
ncbi:putative letm1-like protein [Echria macrotheca]|uniref:Letm1-like protein n=1 Tax=Echria macrotheca TaxID=438768 RepID=A0AAJ0FD68_9PEZI|nr:putative letm1-like protein [Echria macrotheca]